MTNQPGFPVNPAAGVAAAAMAPDADDDSERSDRGNDAGAMLTPDLLESKDEDDGVPVGHADAEEDRRRAQQEGDET